MTDDETTRAFKEYLDKRARESKRRRELRKQRRRLRESPQEVAADAKRERAVYDASRLAYRIKGTRVNVSDVIKESRRLRRADNSVFDKATTVARYLKRLATKNLLIDVSVPTLKGSRYKEYVPVLDFDPTDLDPERSLLLSINEFKKKDK